MIGTADILKARILIVDDQKANVALLDQILRGANYSAIASTTDPRAVCELHRQNRYDLILLDLQMPHMDGFQVMEGLKQIEIGGLLPVIVITAQPAHKLRALKCGARDFVSKPFDLAEVLLRVHNMIELRLLHQDETVLNLERLENSQRIASLGDWEFDFASRRLVWSDEIYRILGTSRNGQPPTHDDFYRQVHPDDLAFVHRERSPVVDGARRVAFEHRIIRADGEVRFIRQVTETVFNAQGQPLRESGTIQDITDRKRSEEALRMQSYVLESMVEGVNVVNEEGIVLFSNAACDTMFGYPLGSLVGQRASVLNEPTAEVNRGLETQVKKQLELAGRWNGEIESQKKDGTTFITRTQISIMVIEGQKCSVAVRQDITLTKQLELQLLRVQRVEGVSRLASGIAHDMNNILAPILMAVPLLRGDGLEATKAEKLFAAIETCANRGAHLVKQLLYFGRGIEGQRTALRMVDSVREVQEMISQTFSRSISVRASVSTDAQMIFADSTQIHQVLLNLCINARDAMPNGGKLSIDVTNISVDEKFVGRSPEAQPGAYVQVAVSDTGTGIPVEQREKIFDPFFTTKEIGKGTGLGLSTVIAIVKGHGGFITLESEMGRGTTFRVYLPAAAAASLPKANDSATVLTGGKNETVLVVDDEECIRHVTGSLLKRFGYRVLTANNGAEGTVLFAQHAGEIKLVVTDYDMPVMDGLAMIRVLKNLDPATKFIMTTGKQSGVCTDENMAELETLGVNTFVSKPFAAETILSAIHRLLGSGSMVADLEKRLPGRILVPPS